MYRNRKYNKSAKSAKPKDAVANGNKRPQLNSIDEDASIKIARTVATVTTGNPGSIDDVLSSLGGSEEQIPASQEPTQRYLSQRSAIASTLVRTQSRNITGGYSRPANNYFELVMIKAGVLLDEGDNFVLSCNHVAFVNRFREILTKCPNYPENVEMFKSGLRDALDVKSSYSLKLLSGCTISIPGENSVYQSQESMIVNFLMISFLCDHVVQVLLDKIDDAATESNNSNRLVNNVPLLPLLLAQLRYVALSHSALIYSRIKEIFQKATEVARRDIIANAELMLDANRHDDFVQLLLDHMQRSKDAFSTNTLQALTNLSLSLKTQEKLRHRIVEYIQDDECDDTLLPLLINFLLKTLHEANEDCVRELVVTIRQILICRIKSTMERQLQVELFKFIEQALIRNKKFYTTWQKLISSLSATQFRCIDLVMLLLLIHIKEDNYLYIENILRRRIKLEHIQVDIFDDLKANFSGILVQHTNTLMQLINDFFKERSKIVADFAKASYGILFQICDTTQRTILKRLLQLTCDKSTHNMTNLALELLRDLQRKYPEEIQNWSMLLMPLLDRLNDMSLSQTRLVMELLCSIAFPTPPLAECPALQDQIDMLLKKQIISRLAYVKKQGIIGSVQLIDSMARIEDSCVNCEDLNVTYNTASELPDGRGKMAANYIMLINSAAMYCPESLALFYDELASVCACGPNDRSNSAYLDKPFLIWLCDLMTYYFQTTFIAEQVPENALGISLTFQKCINRIENDDNTEESELPTIAINIAELVLKPKAVAASSILVLAPLFNLMRVLHLQRTEGSLEQINALLGCAIVLPSFFDEPNIDAIFYNYDEQLQKKILDIYFHCVNWMRETVSSFSTQREEMIRHKVLQRLTELIEMEDKVRALLLKAPADYVPPKCQFICTSTTATAKCGARGRPATDRKTQKKPPAVNNTETSLFNETNANVTNIGDITAKLANVGKGRANSCKKNFDVLYGPKETYRQMDSDIMLILRENLNITYPLPPEDVGMKIGLLELRFILTDLVNKLESITGVQKFQSEQTLQHIAKPYYFMCDMSKFMATIIANMKKLANAIRLKLDAVKQMYSNAELFTDEFNYLKVCFYLSVRLLAAYFSWSQFADATLKTGLLKESLLLLLERTKAQSLCSKSVAMIATEVFDMFLPYESAVVELKTAVHLYQLMVTLRRFSASSEPNTNATSIEKQGKEIRSLCNTFLHRKWFYYDGTLEKGGNCNVYLDMLVKGFLKNSDFRRQNSILHVLLEECKQLCSKDSALKSFPNFKKTNFPLLFRGLCETVISYLSDLIRTNEGSSSDKLKMWERSCELFNTLLDIVKALDVPRNFQLFLKYSHLYLKLVLQHGLQVFEHNLRQDPERVSEFLKSLQTITRFLHNLCCHSKALRNTTIVSLIPALRETVEALVFRVKALMTVNKCASVFSMGNLKNKDLHGDEILSQTVTLNSDHTDSEEDLPDDDASVDETILEQEGSENIRKEITTGNSRSKSSSRSKCF